VWGFILLLRLKNKNKVLKKSVNYFLALMKEASFDIFFSENKPQTTESKNHFSKKKKDTKM